MFAAKDKESMTDFTSPVSWSSNVNSIRRFPAEDLQCVTYCGADAENSDQPSFHGRGLCLGRCRCIAACAFVSTQMVLCRSHPGRSSGMRGASCGPRRDQVGRSSEALAAERILSARSDSLRAVATVSAHASICTPRPASISIGLRRTIPFSCLPDLKSISSRA